MSRKKNSLRNLIFALFGQGFGLIISFFARLVFVRTLGSEYLGLNGLFTNILTVLSLAELGVGEAIVFSLYKPLATKDITKCKSLMILYKKIYVTVGLIIFFSGVVITPFLPIFISNIPSINNVETIFILFVINTSISYFFSYRRNLIIADQKKYIATIYRYTIYFFLNLSQIIYLLFTKNYIGFLILQIAFTLLENYLISRKAVKMYPFLKDCKEIGVDNNTKKEVFKNSKAMFMHKIGGVVVSSTDNILISKFVNLVEVGLYSNYFMIISALNTIFSQFYNSISASVGNLFAKTNEKKQFEVFEKVDFLGFWIYSFSSICLLCLFNPFIQVWLGDNFLFDMKIVLIIVINYYITGMRKSNLTFREASGLFYIDRWKAIIEALVNLVLSIVLAIKLGTIGVLLGTTISSITVCVWVEPFVLYKYGFKINPLLYFKNYIMRFFMTITIGIVTYYLVNLISGTGAIFLLLKGFVAFVTTNALLVLFNYKNDSFKYYCKNVKILLKRGKKNENFACN